MGRMLLIMMMVLLPVTMGTIDVSDLMLNNGTTSLPFDVMTHPMELSSQLYASDLLADRPFPTGAWWTNLVLDKGESTVVLMPYACRLLTGKLHISYPFRLVLPHNIQMGFVSHVVLSASTPLPVHRVIAYDSFGVTVRFTNDRNAIDSFYDVYLVRGSPYVSIEYTNTIPVLETMDGLRITKLKHYSNAVDMSGEPLLFANWACQLTNGQIWHIFASDRQIQFELVHGRIVASATYNGVLRIALAPSADALPYIQESASTYVVGGDVAYTTDPVTNMATVEFQWKTRYFNDTKNTDKKPLILALPHHMDVLLPSQEIIPNLLFTSIRGMMTGVMGMKWVMQEVLPTVEWDYAYEGLFRPENSSSKRSNMAANATEAILTALDEDIKLYPQLSPDVYNFGKQISREARLLLIADRMGQTTMVQTILSKLQRELGPWLTASNSDRLVYDQRYGGLVTSAGLRDQGADYGNGWYNDHHFHYGYLINALAIVRKFAPEFIQEYAMACAMILADIGTPLDHESFQSFNASAYFPIARHKDWFVGHSYASGLFSMQVGKSQESSSEAVHAYYGVALFSSLDPEAISSSNSYFQYTRLLLALELRATKYYWHMHDNSVIYEPEFAHNAMVGVVGDMSVVYSTWFGDLPIYVHGINMIPFTPITTLLLNEGYVAHEYALLVEGYKQLSTGDIWKSSMILDFAIVDAEAAWNEFTHVTALDTWNSKSNSLLWMATRRSWYEERKLVQPKSHAGEQCFGFPLCATAGENGTALGCCSALPGCCPSGLACCPKVEQVNLPLNACYGEPKCGVLGLSCCNSIDGCCEPDPVTGAPLGCCKDQSIKKPLATITKPSSAAYCTTQPMCAALNLDCCETEQGCCAPDAPLGCCVPESVVTSSVHTTETVCHSQPRCAEAGLDCCATDAGCCTPDPTTGLMLDCCDPISATSSPVASEPMMVPTENTEDASLCHNEPVCAKAGLDCCLSAEGCCVPDPNTGTTLLCCQNQKEEQETSETTISTSTTTVVLIVVGACVLFVIVFAISMYYRRRHYTPIHGDGDMRTWVCGALMVMVASVFIYMVFVA